MQLKHLMTPYASAAVLLHHTRPPLGPPSPHTSQMSLLSLNSNCLVCILCNLDNPQDLLRLGRTCSQLHAVSQADEVWRALIQQTYGAAAATASRQPPCYREQFKER